MTHLRLRHPNMMLLDQLLGSEYYGGKEDSRYPQFAHPATNITEDSEGYRIYMAVPGIEKEHIKIELEKNVLTISYEAGEADEKEIKYIRREFNPHSFSRSFMISDKTMPEKSTANYSNGILTLYIPKKDPNELTTIRNIEIK
jgi:HSP20 family protein